MQPIAYYYELANAINPKTKEYSVWTKHVTFQKPSVPEGSIRNYKELYEKPTKLLKAAKYLADYAFKNMSGGRGDLIDNVYHAIEDLK